ncbi:hypothetical protein CEXT_320121 [Caerostris extrusa]|uniref:Uncharacterized protein n=1 Tax=Caerostris extrusa TaxID=172846 RepID=A0AAV4WZA4_CAEEX|nr:hypothetical protein CEXT_320121 [Caerostris extrusa]
MNVFPLVLHLPTTPGGGLKQFQVISFRYADAYLMRFRDIKIEIPSSIPRPPHPLPPHALSRIFHVKEGGFSGSVSGSADDTVG